MIVINLRKYFIRFLLISLLICVGILCAIIYLKPADFLSGKDYNRAMSVTKSVVVQPQETDNMSQAALSDFYAEYRIERDRLRSERIDLLREVTHNGKNEDSARQKAQESIIKITLDRQKEMEMENLIKAKGFSDALVFIRDSSVNAIIKTHALSKEEVMQIADIIAKSTGMRPENITISTKQ